MPNKQLSFNGSSAYAILMHLKNYNCVCKEMKNLFFILIFSYRLRRTGVRLLIERVRTQNLQRQPRPPDLKGTGYALLIVYLKSIT